MNFLNHCQVYTLEREAPIFSGAFVCFARFLRWTCPQNMGPGGSGSQWLLVAQMGLHRFEVEGLGV